MKKIIILIFIIIFIPLLIIGLSNNKIIVNKIKYGIYNNKIVRVKRISKNKIDNVPLEEYVANVVAGEIPVSFNNEAIKAQAVASRTYVLKQMEVNSKNTFDVVDTTGNQVYLDTIDLKNKWAANYKDNYSKIINLVNQTKGEVLLYDNNIIDALFFSTSNGYTENSEDVFSSSEPYLVSVTSPWDKTESPVFRTSKQVTKQEFLFNLNLSGNNIVINNIKKTKTGRVKEITINNTLFKAKDITSAFSLRSTSFDISINENIVTFNVSGFGHGVGMSQYGANGMAKEKKDYQTILKYYYKNCEIKKIY